MSIPGPDDITRYELPNGIVVLVRENHNSPSVVIRGFLRVGAYDERPEQAGLSAFTAAALTRGTVNRTFEQIYEELEAVGASVGISGGTHTTGFGAKSLVEDLPLVLDILADALRYPTFPREEVEKLRGEIITDLEERAHDTRRMANLTFHELAYPKEHPYSRSLAGYIETIGKLSRDDLAEFYAGGYGPQGMVIVVVGAVETGDALAPSAIGGATPTSASRSPRSSVSPRPVSAPSPSPARRNRTSCWAIPAPRAQRRTSWMRRCATRSWASSG